jgi:catalase
MRVENGTDPVYYPNSVEGAPAAYEVTYAERAVWSASGEMVRAACSLHAEDDDYGQANTLVNHVLDDAARSRLVGYVASYAAAVKREHILQRVFEYWRNIDKAIGERVEAACLEKRKTGAEADHPTVSAVAAANARVCPG